MAALLLALPVLRAQELIWENQGLVDEDAVVSGSTFAYNGAVATVTWSVTTDGGFATYPGGSGSSGGGNDYVTYEASQEGAHTGLLLLAFDNSSYDKDDFISLTVSFSQPQLRLAFSLLDIDSENWDDMVDLIINGTTNVRANTSLWSYAASAADRTVTTDDEPGFTGWESLPSDSVGADFRSNPDENFGNIDVNLDGVSVNSFTITFRSTNDSGGNPGGQKIGFSDFYIVPEPSSALAGIFLLGCAMLARCGIRRSRS